jgi:hypothetical protein
MIPKKRDLSFQLRGLPHVVRVEKGDEGSIGFAYSPIPRHARPPVLLIDVPHSLVAVFPTTNYRLGVIG